MLILGQVGYTATITNDTFTNLYFRVFVIESTIKHLNYDFGILCEEDHNANMRAIQHGGALLLAFAAIKTNISIFSKSQVIGELLRVVTVDVLC